MSSAATCTICAAPWQSSCRDHPVDKTPRWVSPVRRKNAARFITVNCKGCGIEFETWAAPSMRRVFHDQACSARTATQRGEGTFEAAKPVSRAERLAAAVARNPEMARRYGL